MAELAVEVVEIRKVNGDGALKAFADVKFAEALVIKGFSVLAGAKGVFVSMPRKPWKDGKWFDTVVPVTDIVKRRFEEKVLEAYDREIENED